MAAYHFISGSGASPGIKSPLSHTMIKTTQKRGEGNMGLTKSSTGTNLLEADYSTIQNPNGYTVALAGNPNVGKSTIFNSLTGMHQHTGNWPGKTVANATGEAIIQEKSFLFVDIPGTYSIMSNSEEEEIARDYICFGHPDATVVVVDATCLERNLNLALQIMEITPQVIICVNLLDEAKKKKIKIDLKKLSEELGVPVVGTIAKKKSTLDHLQEVIYQVCSGEIKPKPKPMNYAKEIEDSIALVENTVKKEERESRKAEGENVLSLPDKWYRWIALKLLDGEEKIIASIQENFLLSLERREVVESVKQARENLQKKQITQENFKDKIVSGIMEQAEKISQEVCVFENQNYQERDRKIDQILTSKRWGIPIMILFLGLIFWITIVGANYPSQALFAMFGWFQERLIEFATWVHSPLWLSNLLILGVYQTLTWVIAVMLPPMAIFFPLFTFLEDLGYLPRIAFNMDGFFKKACCSGKQMITMCMGFGCNAAGVVGCRIIDSPRERLIAILTNNLVPCNGRFPFLISIATIFVAGLYGGLQSTFIATLAVIGVVIFGIFLSLMISRILSKTILKGMPSSFVLELPPYRKPQVGKILVRSIFDRALFVLGRAIAVAAPAGLVIWLLANVGIGGESLLTWIANFLNPFAQLMGLDGYILTAFILGIPANEIVLPIILMCYLRGTALMDMEDTFAIGQILIQNGWTILTAINVMIFTILHFPCATTLLTIKKETGSLKWTLLSFAIPTVLGIVICMGTNLIYHLIGF